MSVSLPCIGQVVFSHVFALTLVVGRVWKEKLTKQWIRLFMENPMVYLVEDCIHNL